jgi:hypothetical protein
MTSIVTLLLPSQGWGVGSASSTLDLVIFKEGSTNVSTSVWSSASVGCPVLVGAVVLSIFLICSCPAVCLGSFDKPGRLQDATMPASSTRARHGNRAFKFVVSFIFIGRI